MKRILITAAAAAAALAGSAAVAAPAMASNGVTAVTHSAQHDDTTSGPLVGALKYSDNGPVWAYDNLSEHFTVTPYTIPQTDGANYSVVITDTGSFQGFADPGANGTQSQSDGYGQALTSTGSVKGTIQYDVSSATPPNPANLPAQEPDHTSMGVALNQLFGATDGSSIFADAVGPHVTGGGNYNFSYQNGNYVQSFDGTTSIITGDVKGH